MILKLLLKTHLDGIYKIIEECNSNKERKILIAFDDMIVDKIGNKSLIQ